MLEVTSSLDNVYNRIWDKALTELFNNAVKTLLVAVFALLLFQRSVTRHLYHHQQTDKRGKIGEGDGDFTHGDGRQLVVR